ncbi:MULTISPECIES: MFS transporter [Falsihalocynthiibacter]|uniref:MFS transporter n=1 Tax=Falsihalocynthiibacter TaxID=2854182 RepID=UPI0030023203
MQLKKSFHLSRVTAPAFMAQGFTWGIFAAYAPDIKSQINASDAVFGWVLLCGAVGAVTAMWLAPIFDRLAGRYGMAIGAVLLAVAFQFPILAQGPVLFGALMFFVGAFSGLLDVVMNARLSVIESRERTSLMNLNHALFSFAYAASAITAGLLRDDGASINSVAFGLLILISITALGMIQPRASTPAEISQADTKPALWGAVFWGGLIVFAAFLSENAVEGWSALHIERNLGGGAAEGAFGPAMLGLTMGFGRFGGQVIVSRISEARVVLFGSLLAAVGATIAAFAPTPIWAYVGFGLLGLGVSVIAPMVFALVGRRVPDEIRAQAISRVAVIGYLGFFVGPPIVGFLAGAVGLPASFIFVALVLLAIPLLLKLLRRDARID